MFNVIAKFETTIHRKIFQKDFEEMLLLMDPYAPIPYTEVTMTNLIELPTLPAIPDKNWIKASEEGITMATKEAFKNSKSVNAEVIGTKFVGFTEIETV